MQEQLWFTDLLNKALGGPVNDLLQKLPAPFHPSNPQAPITNAVAMEFLVMIILLVLFFLVRSRLSVEKPRAMQHTVEMLDGFVRSTCADIIGHHYERFVPLLTTIFVFVLVCNLLGVIPTFDSPTADVTVPLGLAVVSFLYYNWQGFRKNGPAGYLKHFLGPVGWLAPLMLVIETISHFARLLSLTVRLWANIFAGDLVTMAFFSMIPLALPVAFNMLHIGVAILQAYVFMLLTIIYLSGAVAEEH
ncbi:MAG TPA: F0F1 ATP synthase subunit A [Candidatus Angelobacter sp.]